MYCYYLYSAGHVSVWALSVLIDWFIEQASSHAQKHFEITVLVVKA